MFPDHSRNPRRIDGQYIIHEVEHVLHFERGILYTIKELFIRPGECVRKFIIDDRTRLVKPIIFIILTSLIYTVCNSFLHIEEGYIKMQSDTSSSLNAINAWVQSHLGYSNIFMGIFNSLWARLFFKKYGFNIFEILIAMCFYMGISMLIYTLFALSTLLFPIDALQVGGVAGFLYTFWALGQFFDKIKINSYVKAFFAYTLGFISFSVAIILLALLIDYTTKP